MPSCLFKVGDRFIEKYSGPVKYSGMVLSCMTTKTNKYYVMYDNFPKSSNWRSEKFALANWEPYTKEAADAGWAAHVKCERENKLARLAKKKANAGRAKKSVPKRKRVNFRNSPVRIPQFQDELEEAGEISYLIKCEEGVAATAETNDEGARNNAEAGNIEQQEVIEVEHSSTRSFPTVTKHGKDDAAICNELMVEADNKAAQNNIEDLNDEQDVKKSNSDSFTVVIKCGENAGATADNDGAKIQYQEQSSKLVVPSSSDDTLMDMAFLLCLKASYGKLYALFEEEELLITENSGRLPPCAAKAIYNLFIPFVEAAAEAKNGEETICAVNTLLYGFDMVLGKKLLMPLELDAYQERCGTRGSYKGGIVPFSIPDVHIWSTPPSRIFGLPHFMRFLVRLDHMLKLAGAPEPAKEQVKRALPGVLAYLNSIGGVSLVKQEAISA